MASGMARPNQIKSVGAVVAGLLTASLIAGTAFSEGTAPPAAAPVPAPFSAECYNGSTEIVSESPLPNVAAALQKRRTIRILAIGNSAGRRHGGFTRQIERILKQVVKGADVVIINRGVSGELAANAALRIKNEVAISNPDLVIWQVGTDDALAFVPREEFADSPTERPIRSVTMKFRSCTPTSRDSPTPSPRCPPRDSSRSSTISSSTSTTSSMRAVSKRSKRSATRI